MPKNSSREDKRPADLWFWDDWFASTDIKLCSLAAQGLWINMLGIMSRSERKGALLVNGKQIKSKGLATLTGKTEAEITALLDELEEYGVFSKLPDGTIINRRMFRESELRRVRAEAGRIGGKSTKQNESKEESKTRATLEDEDEYEDEDEDKKEKIEERGKIIGAVIAHLNERTGKKFRASPAATVKLIAGRLAEGRTLEDFKHVIDVKAAQWLGDPKMDAFLRPDTLFRPSNFEAYLNERAIPARAAPGARVGAAVQTPEQKAAEAEFHRRMKTRHAEIEQEYEPLFDEARKLGDVKKLQALKGEANGKIEEFSRALLGRFPPPNHQASAAV